MKRFIVFVKKEFIHIFRDTRTLVILFGIPIIQIMLFGFVITNEIKDAKIGILDLSHDEQTAALTEKIVSSGYFQLEKFLNNSDEIDEVFRKGSIKVVLIFNKDFAKNLESEHQVSVQIIADASDPNNANLLVNYLSGILRNYQTQLNENQKLPLLIETEIQNFYNPELKGVFMFVPGTIALILTLISALMTSVTITREKEYGTMEVLLVSPLRPLQIILGKVMPYVFVSFSSALVIILLGYLVFNLPVTGSMVLLLSESLLYIILALSIGVLISTVSNSQQVAMFISMIGLLMPTMLLSGFIFPIENMPLLLQGISILMPPRWFIVIIKNIMLKGNGLLYIWKETLIIIGMIVILIALSVKKFKIRLE